MGVVGTLGALRTLLQTQEINDMKDQLEELETNVKALGGGVGNSGSMVTMAAYIADNSKCCATNTVNIENVLDTIYTAEESVSAICSSVRSVFKSFLLKYIWLLCQNF